MVGRQDELIGKRDWLNNRPLLLVREPELRVALEFLRQGEAEIPEHAALLGFRKQRYKGGGVEAASPGGRKYSRTRIRLHSSEKNRRHSRIGRWAIRKKRVSGSEAAVRGHEVRGEGVAR